MDPQPSTPPMHSNPSPSHLLIKLTNPYSMSQQNDHPNDVESPKANSPATLPLKSPSLKKGKESFSKDDSLDESGSGDDNENLEDSGNKSGKRVYTKRTTDKIRRWTKEESKLYEDFIEMYSDIFNDSSSKRVTKIFIFMASYIGTKTPSQCRSHHQKFFRRIQREKLISSGKAANEEELERLMPKRRKKKSDKNKENPSDNQSKSGSKMASLVGGKNENGTSAENENAKVDQSVENNATAEATTNNGISNGYFPEDIEHINEMPQGQTPLNFIENEGYGKMEPPTQFINLKRNYEAFRKLSVDDKEWMNLFNNKTRRKSSISMLFNNNYFYQTDPELSNNLDIMHRPPNFLDDGLNPNYPPPMMQQNNGIYTNYPPAQYSQYYCNGYPPPIFPNQGFNYNNYEINQQQQHINNDEYQPNTVNDEKGSALLKAATKPVIENQQILWNNAMENVDVIDQYLKSIEKS